MEPRFDYENDEQTFVHCKNCLEKFLGSGTHEHMSPADFMDYCASAYPFTFEDGTTDQVFVLWCKHCKQRVWDSRHLIPRTSQMEIFIDGEWRPMKVKPPAKEQAKGHTQQLNKQGMQYQCWGHREMCEELSRRTGTPISEYACWGVRELIEELDRTETSS
jgi:hypothetical protein